MAGFQELIRLIVDGELVNASVSNRAPQALDGNIRYLKEILEASLLGQTLFARFRTVDPQVNEGQLVFYNPITQQFEQALASVMVEPLTGAMVTTISTYVWGIVTRKLAADKADVLLQGVAEIDLSHSVSGDVQSGMYFLSGSQPGYMVAQQPPVSVPVCLVAGLGKKPGTHEVYVNPDLRDLLQGHKHYRVELQCRPCGTVTETRDGKLLNWFTNLRTGGRHVLSNVDTNVEGWLPASDPSFNGKAPPGACFGYNLAASRLGNLWPPIPIQGAYLEWNKGEHISLLGMGVPQGDNELVVINTDGIWWMSNCFDDVPWSGDFEPLSLSESLGEPVCPRVPHMRMTIWFTSPTFGTSQACVLSLTPRPNSGLVTYCAGTNEPANVGNLDIDLDLQLLMGATDLPGYRAFKQLNGKTFDSGPVVEALKAGTSNVTITGVAGKSLRDPDGFNYGKLVINVQDELNGLEMPVETVRLAGAYEAFPNNTIGLAFDSGKVSTIYGRLGVRAWPTLPAGTTLKLRFWVLAREAGAIPAGLFTATYRRIPQPTATLLPQDLPILDTDLAINCEVDSVAQDQYVLMETDTFPVAEGDTVMFSLTRSAVDDYTGELDVLRKCGVLVVPGN